MSAPPGARAAGASVTTLVGGAGNQTAPALGSGYLVYLDDSAPGGDAEVRIESLAGSVSPWVTSDGIAQGWPRIQGGLLAWRNPGEIALLSLFDAVRCPLSPEVPCPSIPKTFRADGAGRIALGSGFVAWEEPAVTGPSGSTTVSWARLDDSALPVGEPLRLGAGGSVAAQGGWLAWADSAAGRVTRIDTTGFEKDLPLDLSAWGTVAEVALDAAATSAAPGMAVTVEGGTGTRLLVVDAAGGLLAALAPDGTKDRPSLRVNPHLYGEWVGFEDLSLTVPQVILWHWKAPQGDAPALYFPSASAREQRLHDLAVGNGTIDVVWAEQTALGDFDILHFLSPLPIEGGGGGSGAPAACTDANPIVVYDVERLTAKPAPYGTHFLLPADVNHLLVCLESTDVTAGWVAVGTKVVAAPGDFGRGSVHGEVRLAVKADEGKVGAVLAGKPGATLRVKVFLDAGGKGDGSSSGSTCNASGDCPPAPTAFSRDASGCATSGGSASLALLLAPVALLLASRRRARR